MTDTITELRQTDPAKPPSRGRGPLLALAVAAAVTLVVGVAAFSVLTGDEQTLSTDAPAPTTTTTVAPTTTAAPTPTTVAPQSLLPADTPPLQVVKGLSLKWNRGDVAGGFALFHPDTAGYLPEDLKAGIGEELWYRWATRMETKSECELATPVELADRTPRVPGAQMVTCVDTITSGLEPGVVVAGGTIAVEIADGWIYDFFILDFDGALDGLEGLNGYRSWIQENIPDRYTELFNPTTLNIVVDTPQARETHRELVPFFVADTAPRPERALPADTPKLEVVTEFQRRYDAGDVEGYEAIINPAIGYPPGNNAPASWFTAVTGMTSERTCTEVDAITVSCSEQIYSGLVPGRLVGEITVEYVARNGWILAVNFPDGPADAEANPGTATGVAEYRDWVRTNAPDEFDSLFADGVQMSLSTLEVRAQHEAMITTYLAATG